MSRSIYQKYLGLLIDQIYLGANLKYLDPSTCYNSNLKYLYLIKYECMEAELKYLGLVIG